MPVTKSAKKALSVAIRRKAENDVVRAKIKSTVKGAKISIKDGLKDGDEKLKAAYRELDIAAKKNVIHKNKAARLKSRLAKAIGQVKEDKPTAAKKKKKS